MRRTAAYWPLLFALCLLIGFAVLVVGSVWRATGLDDGTVIETNQGEP